MSRKKSGMQNNTLQRINKQMNKENMFLRIHIHMIMEFKCVEQNERRNEMREKWNNNNNENKAMFCCKEIHKSHKPNWAMEKICEWDNLNTQH